ncbi:hypothetical protein [Helicobacter suis]|nr:hypothetical protein [Helicobacter suis]BCD45141.1 hypothetical protein NHP190020_01800 [Helicobacter suis]BCD48475.1 hypothetical protein NHP194003_16790 [Helicobacter suis]BCD50253.1 hypothetical protein NHP194004_17000 [Helicobacter suis]BCD51996.1 hypothetical protein NHP194022_16670 [Helicobacter suis]BDR29019.1 hypothetical protein HSHS1_17800 [Helicobacter suis HS1]
MLAPNALSETYVFKNDHQVITFSVCEGQGTLNPLDYPKAYHFVELDVKALELYLMHQQRPTSAKQAELIQAFLTIYDLNISKSNYYLTPPYFKKVEEKLLC